MNGKKWLIVGISAAAAFLLLRAANAGSGGGRVIEGTDGKRYLLNERDGKIFDQFGGLWL